MYSLKDKIAADLDNVFFNPDEFGEKHKVEGAEIDCIFDDSMQRERSGGAEFAVGESYCLLYARSSDLPTRQGYGSSLLVDGVDYMVIRWDEDAGMSSVTLSNTSMS